MRTLRGARSAALPPEASAPPAEALSADLAGSGRAARRRHDPWRTAFFGILVLAILAGAAWALLGSSLLVVRHEEVTGNRMVSAGQVLAAAAIKHGTPLESVDLAAAAHRVERISQVLSATVGKSWPDTIVISIRERTPVFAVASANRFALVDQTGVVVRWAKHKPGGMPALTAPVLADVRGSAAVRSAAAVLGHLPAGLRGLVNSVAAPGAEAVTLRLRGGITVLWGGPGQAGAKAAEVIVLLRAHTRYIDVSDPSTAVTQG